MNNGTDYVTAWLRSIGGDYLRVIAQASDDANGLAGFLRCKVLGELPRDARHGICGDLLLTAINDVEWVEIARKVIKGEIR